MMFQKKSSYKYNLKKIKEKNITELRKKVKVLMIDDEEYDIVELLKNRGYNVYYKEDISYALEVEPFDIVILDIKGVAKKFGSTYEGFGFAKEIKMIYPHKLVLCYSGTSDININEQLGSIDGFIKKDTDIDVWSQKLDSYIKKYCSIDYHWKIIESQLKDQNTNEKTIDSLRGAYVKSFETDSFDELKNTFMLNMSDVKMFIEVLGSLISLIKIFV